MRFFAATLFIVTAVRLIDTGEDSGATRVTASGNSVPRFERWSRSNHRSGRECSHHAVDLGVVGTLEPAPQFSIDRSWGEFEARLRAGIRAEILCTTSECYSHRTRVHSEALGSGYRSSSWASLANELDRIGCISLDRVGRLRSLAMGLACCTSAMS